MIGVRGDLDGYVDKVGTWMDTGMGTKWFTYLVDRSDVGGLAQSFCRVLQIFYFFCYALVGVENHFVQHLLRDEQGPQFIHRLCCLRLCRYLLPFGHYVLWASSPSWRASCGPHYLSSRSLALFVRGHMDDIPERSQK